MCEHTTPRRPGNYFHFDTSPSAPIRTRGERFTPDDLIGASNISRRMATVLDLLEGRMTSAEFKVAIAVHDKLDDIERTL